MNKKYVELGLTVFIIFRIRHLIERKPLIDFLLTKSSGVEVYGAEQSKNFTSERLCTTATIPNEETVK